MLVEFGAHRCLRRVKLLGDSKILLQSGDRELDAQALHISELITSFPGAQRRLYFERYE